MSLKKRKQENTKTNSNNQRNDLRSPEPNDVQGGQLDFEERLHSFVTNVQMAYGFFVLTIDENMLCRFDCVSVTTAWIDSETKTQSSNTNGKSDVRVQNILHVAHVCLHQDIVAETGKFGSLTVWVSDGNPVDWSFEKRRRPNRSGNRPLAAGDLSELNVNPKLLLPTVKTKLQRTRRKRKRR